ncbi:hypothetical protein [Pararhizobium gei]|uniref:hypothetical protein n=1 Tax=Pararhizobium gei TaxID=1395951 RepID=UPI0023DAE30C|nr:hypothetical protein [Rhizobium gei]
MAHVRFTGDFDYRPTKNTVIGYLEGMALNVRRECAEQAIAAGKAVETKPKGRASTSADSDTPPIE